MSRYYTPQAKPISISSTQAEQKDTRDSGASFHLANDSTVYIFPNPSSAPPSPSQYSEISAPTDFSISADSDNDWCFVRPSDATDVSSSTCSPRSNYSDVACRQWDWMPDLATRMDPRLPTKPTLDETILSNSGDDEWHLLMRRRKTEIVIGGVCESRRPSFEKMYTEIIASKPDQSNTSRQTPFPLLTFLTTLFSIDDSTADLLTSPCSQSILFPGSSLVELDIDIEKETSHIDDALLRKLLSHPADRSYQNIRDGLRVIAVGDHTVTPSAPSSSMDSTSRMSSLWRTVTT